MNNFERKKLAAELAEKAIAAATSRYQAKLRQAQEERKALVAHFEEKRRRQAALHKAREEREKLRIEDENRRKTQIEREARVSFFQDLANVGESVGPGWLRLHPEHFRRVKRVSSGPPALPNLFLDKPQWDDDA